MTITITRCARQLAASASQEPCGSSAPSIRGGAPHRTPETPFGKPGSESPFSPSVPRGNPVYVIGDSHQLVAAVIARQVRSSDSWRRSLHDGAFRDLSLFHVPPQRNQELPRQRHDANPPHPFAPAPEPPLIPARQRAGLLIVHPTPGQLHHQAAHVLVAGARDSLVVVRVATLIGRRDQADQRPQFAAIPNLSPAKDLGRQDPRADRPDPAQGW